MDFMIELIKTVVPDTTFALIYVTLIFLTLWMYKELRKNYVESRNENLRRIERAIECYTDLEFVIYKYINGKSDFFAIAEKVSNASSIVPYVLLKKYNKCKEETDINKRNQLIVEFHAEIQEEIKILKHKQSELISLKSNENMLDVAANYIKTKIAPFATPFLHTFVNIILLLITINFTIEVIYAPTIQSKILKGSLIVCAFIYGLHMLLIGAVFMEKRFKHSILNWSLLLLFVLLPHVLFFIGPWYRGILLLILMLAYSFYASTKSIKKYDS